MIKLRAKFRKEGNLIYISHLDLMRMFMRAFRRANIPVKYTEGFNPHPKFSLATALAIGVSSASEFMDIELSDYIDEDEFLRRMNKVLPDGAEILQASYVKDKDSLMSTVSWSCYVIQFSTFKDLTKKRIEEEIETLMNRDEILLTKSKEKKKKVITKDVNVREFIKDIVLLMHNNDNTVILKVTLKTGSRGNLKPDDFIKILDDSTNIRIADGSIKIHRLELFLEKDGKIVKPL